MKTIQSKKALFSKIKSDFESETGIKLDFRRHVFLENQYGGYPCFSYDLAKTLIPFIYKWAESFRKEHEENYPHFSGWEYDTLISIEELRTTKLKDFIEEKIDDLYYNFVDSERREGNSVFIYNPEARAYIYSHSTL